jgi:hypothetical protein
MMLDAKTRLLEARQALHHLELEIEQYRIHIAELAGRHQIERARVVLDQMAAELEAQRRYCDLIEKADGASDVEANSGSARAA